jgi:hypothetical protein
VVCSSGWLNNLISPTPSAGSNNSVKLRVGHPPPGNSLSSLSKPLGITGSVEDPNASPRQILFLNRASICKSDGGAEAEDIEGGEASIDMAKASSITGWN